jgi:hypothetical protein
MLMCQHTNQLNSLLYILVITARAECCDCPLLRQRTSLFTRARIHKESSSKPKKKGRFSDVGGLSITRSSNNAGIQMLECVTR